MQVAIRADNVWGVQTRLVRSQEPHVHCMTWRLLTANASLPLRRQGFGRPSPILQYKSQAIYLWVRFPRLWVLLCFNISFCASRFTVMRFQRRIPVALSFIFVFGHWIILGSFCGGCRAMDFGRRHLFNFRRVIGLPLNHSAVFAELIAIAALHSFFLTRSARF